MICTRRLFHFCNLFFKLLVLTNFVREATAVLSSICTDETCNIICFTGPDWQGCPPKKRDYKHQRETGVLWPNRNVFYDAETSINLTSFEKNFIRSAMDHIQDNTCVEFVDINSDDGKKTFEDFEPGFLLFERPPAGSEEICESEYIGYLPESHSSAPLGKPAAAGFQYLYFGTRCTKRFGYLQHALMHVIGLFHTNALKSYSFNYVRLWFRKRRVNVRPGYSPDFFAGEKSTYRIMPPFYDYRSVMHMPVNDITDGEWSCNPTNPLLETVEDFGIDYCLGQRIKATDCDLDLIDVVYGCRDNFPDCVENIPRYQQNGSCDYLF